MQLSLTCARSFFAALLAVLGGMVAVRAQSDITAQFPEVAQVTADFPDDAQRSAALSVLYDDYQRTAPKPVSRADYGKMMLYSDSSNAIQSAHMANGGMQNGDYRAFNTQFSQFLDDRNFRSSVLEKYHLVGLVPHPRASAATIENPPRTDAIPVQNPAAKPVPTDQQQIIAALLKQQPQPVKNVRAPLDFGGDVFDILPWAIGLSIIVGIIPMRLAAWLVLRRSGIGRKVLRMPAQVSGGLGALPEPLQVVSLPNVRYTAYAMSGLVLDVRRQQHRSTFTASSPTIITHDGHGNSSVTPGTTTHYTSTSNELIAYVRKTNGLEAPWSIYDSTFDCRPGNIISLLVRPLPDDTSDIMMAYNHASGDFAKCNLDTMHAARGNELGQWAANLAGAASAWYALSFFTASHEDGQLSMFFLVIWLFLCLIMVTISFMILTPRVHVSILKKRNAVFNRKYLPGYQQFFQQGTPLLKRTFGVR